MPQVRANGVAIEYESFGRDSDPVILLIMGLAAQLTLWPESLCRGLAAKGFRVIRFDNRDIGKSTHLMDKGAPDLGRMMADVVAGRAVAPPYTLNDMAADAMGLLDAIGVSKAHIVGASMGGMIAQIIAAHYPARTKSLVSVMSTTGRRGLPPAKPEVMAVLLTPPPSFGREDRIEAAIHAWRVIGSPGYPSSDAEIRALAEREVDYVPFEPTGAVRQMAATIATPPRNELLKKVRAPTLVLHGGADPLVPPAAGEDTARSISGARLIVIPGVGHDMNDRLAPLYLRHVGDFIAEVETLRNA